MAHDDSRRRRERPRRSTGGSEAYLPPRREFTRRDGLNYNEGEVFTRWESNDEAEPATRPFVIRRRGDARRRSFRRESTGVELAPEAAVITESPTAVRYVASSDGEDHERFDRPIREYEDPYERRPPPVATRDEVIIERQDGRSRRFESDVNPPPRYVDAEGDGYRVRRPVSPIIEDIDAFDDFHFVLPAEDLSKDAELSDLETPTTESESTPKIERPLSPTLAAPGIYSSSYFGTAELGAQHDVNLTVLHDPRGQKQPLFRWLHVRQEIMNFDAFWVQVSRHIRFRDAERKAVVNLKAEVKRQCVKTRYNPQGAKPSNKKPPEDSHAANWICIPYFHLQQYSESPSASNTALFPAQTLLQSQYSRSSQQRDMDQAVCQIGQVPRGECFHISQLWCLIVGNKCQTWFAFISHFHAFWPQKLEFWRKDRLITAENWGKILELAEGLRGDVRDAPDMVRTFLKPDAVANKASEKRPEQSAATPEYLHVFTLLSKNAESSGDSILQDLREQLSAAEKFLTEKTSYTAQRGYKRCELMTKDGAQEQLEKLAVRVEEKKSDTIRRSYDERLDVFNMADTLFQLFFPLTFHGPTTGKYWGALSKLMHIPELDEDDTARPLFSPISEMRSTLWQLTQDIQSFQNIMSFAGKEDRAAMALPHELVTAWLHIVFGLIYGTYALDWYTHMTKAKSLLREGMQKMIEGISAQNLLDKAVMQPTEIMSLIALNLLQDDVGKYDDICDTYSLYLNSLDTDITTKPSNRMYQHRIDLVKQEMTAIRRNLVRQRNIIAMLRNKMSITDGNFMVRYGEEMPTRMKAEYGLKAEYTGLKRSVPAHRYYEAADEKTIGHGAYDQGRFGVQFLTDLETASKLSSTDAEGFRSLFLTDCANLVEQREYEFKRDTEYAEELERDIRYKMEWTKDKQENAIYAFTLVTIIFLPLSAISSIFGMNTNDIRNMDFDQWLYWVVALPVTVIIIIAGLWWMDELSNATDWLIGRRKRSSEYEGSVSYKSTSSKPTQSVMDYDSIGRSSEDIPGVYRRTRYLRPIRNYTGNVEAPLGTMPRRRRTSFYKY
ncbi:uncharacterized protein TRIVIDRAFT_209419 [Trichoderma virens Gv29-8]|uniref:Mg2+ transporter protein, CorA-like/Zinc transport protein ZntB n=1 Tax=Hypocrea virens (strain Gv29-8 / FGSC 10586) TaxID=413071 RepID=G9MVP5_HYPVG|nr:uncharacterized protein TRIVIDRAFT_209419 [Trichoderma virens Gv29-8]EHK21542.1 hypothetical protein TRIVIDRAFT_209419 [Trichoderma virens Gv29-8]